MNGRLDDMEVSDEINACSVEIEVDVDGGRNWLLMFKNETHNHPTEIEPERAKNLYWWCYIREVGLMSIKQCGFQVQEIPLNH